jgi:hypothetical protein
MGKTADKPISVLDLDALREAFKISAREHHVEGPEWAHFAEQFLIDAQKGKAPARGIAGALVIDAEQSTTLH